jgi:hypothetical protein
MLHIAHMPRLQCRWTPTIANHSRNIAALRLQQTENPVTGIILANNGKYMNVDIQAPQVDRNASCPPGPYLAVSYPQNRDWGFRRNSLNIPPDVLIKHEIAHQCYTGATCFFDNPGQLRDQHDPLLSMLAAV